MTYLNIFTEAKCPQHLLVPKMLLSMKVEIVGEISEGCAMAFPFGRVEDICFVMVSATESQNSFCCFNGHLV